MKEECIISIKYAVYARRTSARSFLRGNSGNFRVYRRRSSRRSRERDSAISPRRSISVCTIVNAGTRSLGSHRSLLSIGFEVEREVRSRIKTSFGDGKKFRIKRIGKSARHSCFEIEGRRTELIIRRREPRDRLVTPETPEVGKKKSMYLYEY